MEWSYQECTEDDKYIFAPHIVNGFSKSYPTNVTSIFLYNHF